MKKVLCIVLALVLLLSAAGCGGDDGSTAGSSAATAPNGATQPSGNTTAPNGATQPSGSATSPNGTTPNGGATTPSSSAPAECTHSFSVNVAAEATCTADGEKIYTCDLCGHSYSESVAATGHSFADATCDVAKTCTVCGATEGSALSHSYTASTKEPGCTAAGSVTYTCDLCGHSYSESIAATGHSYEDGSCINCGKEDPGAHGLTGSTWYWCDNYSGDKLTLCCLRFNEDGTGFMQYWYRVYICEEPETFFSWNYELLELNGVYYAVSFYYEDYRDFEYEVIDDAIHVVDVTASWLTSQTIFEKVDRDHYKKTSCTSNDDEDIWIEMDVIEWACPHDCNEGSCSKHKVCSICGWDFGEQHEYAYQGCGEHMICAVCGAEGPVQDHYFWCGECSHCGDPYDWG